MPDLIEQLLVRALEAKSKALLWRLYLVFNNSINIVDTDIAKRAAIGRLKVQKVLFQQMSSYFKLPGFEDEIN
ncbi:hypothetical protein RG47T_1559 [Mucilaginibacter polytrichastri]|uniref:Uncharacterized protein n=2 Tax=Mucilaginibacter polytrichastri TaxID=1302689 RepID=A0A1Q5ZWG7_9SPHI|nr:hypothetical protein RG47T_1559 [Mucilaginibacter polytrichastri]